MTEEARIAEIEAAVEAIWRLLGMTINRDHFNKLNVIRQTEIESIQSKLTSLEASVETLEKKYNDLL